MGRRMDWEKQARKDAVERKPRKTDPVIGSTERTSERGHRGRPAAGKRGTGLPWEGKY